MNTLEFPLEAARPPPLLELHSTDHGVTNRPKLSSTLRGHRPLFHHALPCLQLRLLLPHQPLLCRPHPHHKQLFIHLLTIYTTLPSLHHYWSPTPTQRQLLTKLRSPPRIPTPFLKSQRPPSRQSLNGYSPLILNSITGYALALLLIKSVEPTSHRFTRTHADLNATPCCGRFLLKNTK